MGFTTIIELNHDRIDEIEQNKEEFLDEILKQMRSIQDFQRDIQGGRIITSFRNENNDKRYKAWYTFKYRFGLTVPVYKKRKIKEI